MIPIFVAPCIINFQDNFNNHFRHLLLPEGVYFERQRANYIFTIYSAENISKAKVSLLKKISVTTDDVAQSSSTKSSEDPNSRIEIEFAGLTVIAQT